MDKLDSATTHWPFDEAIGKRERARLCQFRDEKVFLVRDALEKRHRFRSDGRAHLVDVARSLANCIRHRGWKMRGDPYPGKYYGCDSIVEFITAERPRGLGFKSVDALRLFLADDPAALEVFNRAVTEQMDPTNPIPNCR